MTTPSWTDSEPGALTTLHQAASLLRSGLGRPAMTTMTTLLLVAVVLGYVAFTKHVYAPRLVLQVAEMAREPGSQPRPASDLATYVREAVWTDAALLELIAAQGLYPARRSDSRALLEALRRDTDVEVRQNYFIQERAASDAPRTARVGIRFRSTDPEQAIAVTRALAALVVNHELLSRADDAVRALRRVEGDLTSSRRAQRLVGAAVAARRREIESAAEVDPELQVELVTMLGSLESLELQTAELERRESLLSFGAAIDQQRLGLRFTVVDDGVVARSTSRDRGQLALLVGVALALAFPLVALAVGATRTPRGVA